MKSLLSFIALLLLLVSQPALSAEFQLNALIKSGNSVEFLKFEGSGAFDNYLAMNLPFEPMAALHKQVQDRLQIKLKTRGEAHITVVTPIEYWNVLRPRGINMTEINKIAEAMHIQDSKFEVICLGQGSSVINEKSEQTLFVVVESADLVKIRKSIHDLLVSKGGELKEFSPTAYYPHITLGFTLRDLHESDGIIKDRNSCIGQLELINSL